MKNLLSSGTASMTAARITGDAGQLGMVAGFARGFFASEFANDFWGLLCHPAGGTAWGVRDDVSQGDAFAGDRRRGDLDLWFRLSPVVKGWLTLGDRILRRYRPHLSQHLVYRG